MDDKNAVIDIHAGKQKGATYLYNKYGGNLIGMFKNLGLPNKDTEEVLQETFIRFIKHVKKDTSLDNIKAYLFKIGRNECYRFFLKKKKFYESEVSISPTENNEASYPSIETISNNINIEQEIIFLDCISEELKKFEQLEKNSEKCLEILTLVAEAWSIQEIAVKINRTYGATREFLSQCRKKFKSYIDPCLGKNYEQY